MQASRMVEEQIKYVEGTKLKVQPPPKVQPFLGSGVGAYQIQLFATVTFKGNVIKKHDI